MNKAEEYPDPLIPILVIGSIVAVGGLIFWFMKKKGTTSKTQAQLPGLPQTVQIPQLPGLPQTALMPGAPGPQYAEEMKKFEELEKQHPIDVKKVEEYAKKVARMRKPLPTAIQQKMIEEFTKNVGKVRTGAFGGGMPLPSAVQKRMIEDYKKNVGKGKPLSAAVQQKMIQEYADKIFAKYAK